MMISFWDKTEKLKRKTENKKKSLRFQFLFFSFSVCP